MLRRLRWERRLDLFVLMRWLDLEEGGSANPGLGRTTTGNAQSYGPLLRVTVCCAALFDLDGRPCLLLTSVEPSANGFSSPLRSASPQSNGVRLAGILAVGLSRQLDDRRQDLVGHLQLASILK